MPRPTLPPLKLLVPLDGSSLAEQAIPYARMLAELVPAEVHLLRVVAPAFVERLVHAEAVLLGVAGDELGTSSEQHESMRETLRDEGAGYLEARARELAPHVRKVSHELVFGVPAEQIVAAAAQQGSDIIVMVTHGRGGLLRWALGSITSRVLRLATQPVLIIRGKEQPPLAVEPPKRVLVALDGSPFVERGLPLVTRIAHAARAELLLVQVLEAADERLIDVDGELLEPLRDRALSYLSSVATTITGQVAQPITTAAPSGHIAETIVAEAERKRMDLIVMGRHGLDGTPFAFLGGTTEKVSQASAVPLLVVG